MIGKTYLNGILNWSYLSDSKSDINYAVSISRNFSKRTYATVKHCKAEKGDAELRKYVERLSEAGLPIGEGKDFRALIGIHPNFSDMLSLVILRRRESNLEQN